MEGLSTAEAQRRLAKEGKNLIPRKKISPFRLFIRQFQSWFIFLLLVAALVSVVLGEVHQVLTIFLILGITGFLGFIQEYRHQKIVEKLQGLISSNVWVRRDEQPQVINKEDLVTGDLVILERGDIVPADLKLLNSQGLSIDEAILTGESKPVEKAALKDSENFVFAGTTVITGSGEGIVVKKGVQMKIAQIAKLVAEVQTPSSLEEDVKNISRFIMKLVVATLVLVFAGNILLKGLGIDIPQLLLFISALAIGIVPEALPVVVLVTLSTGAAKMARKKAVVKRLSAIDDFGNIKVLCVDKTGTITQNIFEVNRVVSENEKIFWKIFLASLIGAKGKKGKMRSLLDKALLKKAEKKGMKSKNNWQCLYRLPFDPSLRKEIVAVKKDKEVLIIIKGAPEEILRLSTLEKKEKKDYIREIEKEGGEGKRVYALAAKEIKEGIDYLAEEKKGGFHFYGFASLSDSIKPTVKQTITKAKNIGIDVRVLTGDTPELALKVGREIGLIEKKEEVVSGFDLEKMGNQKRRKVVLETKIFARVTPEQKFQIINILQQNFSVGCLGDGVNDAPALKAANVGIAVDSAADVTKEAADVILLEKDLGVIINGIEEGRKTFVNVMKYIRYTLASNFGNCYALAVISLIIPYLPLLPVQILLVNLLSDFPLISVAVDEVDEREIAKPKRLELREMTTLIILLGVISSIFDFGFFAIYHRFGQSLLQTLWFIESILTEIVFVYSIRTRFFFLKAKRPATPLLFLSGLTLFVTFFLPFSPLADNFYFHRPSLLMVLGVIMIGLSYFATTEVVKFWYYKSHLNEG